MDIQMIIIDCLATIVIALVLWAWNVHVKPWLEDHHLAQAADIAVQAAEAFYGRYNGPEKLHMALTRLQLGGWNVDADAVIDAVRAAWNRLNTQQIAAGIKGATVQEANPDEHPGALD